MISTTQTTNEIMRSRADSVDDFAPESRVRTRRLDTQRQRSLITTAKANDISGGEDETAHRKSNSKFYVSFD